MDPAKSFRFLRRFISPLKTDFMFETCMYYTGTALFCHLVLYCSLLQYRTWKKSAMEKKCPFFQRFLAVVQSAAFDVWAVESSSQKSSLIKDKIGGLKVEAWPDVVVKKKTARVIKLKSAKKCPHSTVAFLCPNLPSFWFFFGNRNSFFVLNQSSNHVFSKL
jgi:hypothetical protein